ncbi:MAG: hypothetical protein ACI4WR_01320 [Bulleidia sp.]
MKDFLAFESIRDKEGNVVCYHVSVVGTIEAEGVPHLRSDIGTSQDQKMSFGKITVHGLDRKIGILTRETDSQTYYHSHDDLDTVNVISFAAREKHADEVAELSEGDRVLLEGRAYLRSRQGSAHKELTITVTSVFLLGHQRAPKPHRMNSGLVPQAD